MFGHSAEGIISIASAAAPHYLRNGSIVRLRVTESMGGGYYRVLWKGRAMTAFAKVPLQKGQIIKARLQQTHNRLEFHIVRQHDKHSISQSKSLDTLSSAILRAGLALPDAAEYRLRLALFSRSSGPRELVARLYAELLAKGMDPTADLLEFIESFFSAKRFKNGKKPQKTFKWNGNTSELKKHLILDAQASDETIDLINLKQGKNKQWYFKDSAILIADEEYRMVWKIRRKPQPALALSIHNQDHSLEFLIEGINPTQLEVFAEEGHGISPESWNRFKQKIESMDNIHVGTRIRPIRESDGFTP